MVEDLLKSGELPCLVATSSLELGIDMGAVDLVIQVESPKSVTAACSGSAAPGTAWARSRKGRIFPKFRADLLECAVVGRACATATIEETVIPRNPLDVLAQQIVAIVAAGDEWACRRAARPGAPRRTRSRELSRELLDNVLDMLDGRYPSRGVRRAAAADRLGPRGGHDPRRARARASWPSPTPARSPTAASTACTCPTAAGWASSTRRWSTRPARARPSCSAPPPGGSRRSPATG